MSSILLLIVVLASANVDASPTCSKNLDLVFVVDTSATVCPGGTCPCPQWDAVKRYCKDIVNGLNIGPDNTRVAFVTLSNDAQVEFDLQKYPYRLPLLQAIDKVPFRAGELTDVLSISKIIIDVLNPLNGDRTDVQNLVILITDGAPNFPHWVYAAQAVAVQETRGAGVFVVCVTAKPGGLIERCTEDCAKGQASPPQKINETYWLLDDYLNIDQTRSAMVKNFCAFQKKDPLSFLPLF